MVDGDGWMTDIEREYAIVQAGKRLEEAQARVEETSCFWDMAARDEARRYMEALIRGRSDAQRQRMAEARGLP